jgi:hypothetical protein
VVVDDGDYDLAFCIPLVIGGSPLWAGMHLGTNFLRLHRWAHDGEEFRPVTRFGHACQIPPLDTDGDGVGDAWPADDGNWQLDVRLRVDRVDDRLGAAVSWEGTTRTCERGGGTFVIDAPIQGEASGPTREPPAPSPEPPLPTPDPGPIPGPLPGPPPGPIPGPVCEGGHWIRSVTSLGRFITLEDGSVWEVPNLLDRTATMLWLPIDDVVICEADFGPGFVLHNTDRGESAFALWVR